MNDYIKLRQKVGKEPIYLYHKMDDAVVRIMPDDNTIVRCFAKIKGKAEYETEWLGEMVGDAFFNPTVITKEEYDNW